ncbi:expressed unknown protein [Seminavis robusta]|uniref:PDZ domain-containing protein n=1 Tax=Seminavis robusta TaxID=568900 RepID=A0A9N8ERP0_9STRA|nr:expressed unknown protein [Seminavis robusta]|eukprot:Sro1593_g284480.1 n/a (852) ;mRNA; r:2813-5368
MAHSSSSSSPTKFRKQRRIVSLPPRPYLPLLLIIAVSLLSQSPGVWAGYFRRPSSGASTSSSSTSSSSGGGGGFGFGSVSQTLRQKNDNDEEEEEEEKEPVAQVAEPEDNDQGEDNNEDEPFFLDDNNKNDQGEDKEDEETFFALDETDFPTGMIPTESPAPTEAPSVFPTTDDETGDIDAAPPLPQDEFSTMDEGTFAVPSVPTQMPTFMPTKSEFPSQQPMTLPPTTAATTIFSAPNNTATTTTPPAELVETDSPTSAPSKVVIATGTVTRPTVVMEEEPMTTSNATDEEATQPVNDTDATTQPLLDFQEEEQQDTEDTTTEMNDNIEAEEEVVSSPAPTTAPDPTAAPTDSSTLAPSTPAPSTPNPSTAPPQPEFPLSGQLSLQLEGIDTVFPGDMRMIFLATADEFIASAAKGHVEDIRVTVIYQNVGPQSRMRRLQSALQVDLGVEGLAYDELLGAKDWNKWLHDLFAQGSVEFVTMLQDLAKAEENTFFEPLTAVTPLEPATAINAPTQPPITSPPLVTTSNTASETGASGGGDDTTEGGGIPMMAIVGAAVGGVVFLIVGVLLIRYVWYMQRQKSLGGSVNNSIAENFGPTHSEDAAEDAPTAAAAATSSKTNRWTSKTKAPTTGIQTKPSNGAESSVSSSSYLTNNANHNNNFGSSAAFTPSTHQPISSPPSDSDNMSQMGATTTGDMSVMDNASYAYSLEPGIEPSVAGGVPQNVVPSSGASAMSYTVYPGGSSVASMTSGTSSFAFLKMPIANRNGGGISGKPTKDVLAPAGKLGIVIDTTLDGPVVHKVNPGSALEGKLKSGDIIVAIDDVDTRAMTAASITALMVKTANQRRKLSVISP